MPSRKVLRRAARHVDHEMEMVLGTGERLRRPAEAGADPLLRRALLEAWGVHYRALLEFFHPAKGTRPDVILAEHYFRDPAIWNRLAPRLTKRQARRREALHIMLAHLSYRRHPRLTRWSVADHELIRLRVRLFFNRLPARRRRWFPQTARRLSNQMDLLDGLTPH